MARNEVTEARVTELIAEAVKGLASKDEVKILIVESDSALRAQLAEALKDQLSEGRVIDLAQGAVAVDPAIAAIQKQLQLLETELADRSYVLSELEVALDQPPLDPAWLEGLTFSSAKQVRETVDGRPRLVARPLTRELTVGDILSYRVDQGAATVLLVTADGKKHTVELQEG